jgi:hypothetical protein
MESTKYSPEEIYNLEYITEDQREEQLFYFINFTYFFL